MMKKTICYSVASILAAAMAACTVAKEKQPPAGDAGPTTCMMHSECASNVCLADASCADAADVAYVDPSGTDAMSCTKELPCPSLQVALGTKRPYVKMTGSSTTAETVRLTNQNVEVFADPGASLARTVPGELMEIAGRSQVSLFDLELVGAAGGDPDTAHGISTEPGSTVVLSLERVTVSNNAGTGVQVNGGTANLLESTLRHNGLGLGVYEGGAAHVNQSSFTDNTGGGALVYLGTLNATQSTFSANGSGGLTNFGSLELTRSTITGNRGSGLLSGAPFRITNNYIVRNHSENIGAGVWLTAKPNEVAVFEFNTVADNATDQGSGTTAGVDCSEAMSIPHNLITRNAGGMLNGSMDPQTSMECDVGDSFIGAPTGNAAGFAHPDSEPYDYHLTAGSPLGTIVDKAECSRSVDFDGNDRPINGKCDVGADERE